MPPPACPKCQTHFPGSTGLELPGDNHLLRLPTCARCGYRTTFYQSISTSNPVRAAEALVYVASHLGAAEQSANQFFLFAVGDVPKVYRRGSPRPREANRDSHLEESSDPDIRQLLEATLMVTTALKLWDPISKMPHRQKRRASLAVLQLVVDAYFDEDKCVNVLQSAHEFTPFANILELAAEALQEKSSGAGSVSNTDHLLIQCYQAIIQMKVGGASAAFPHMEECIRLARRADSKTSPYFLQRLLFHRSVLKLWTQDTAGAGQDLEAALAVLDPPLLREARVLHKFHGATFRFEEAQAARLDLEQVVAAGHPDNRHRKTQCFGLAALVVLGGGGGAGSGGPLADGLRFFKQGQAAEQRFQHLFGTPQQASVLAGSDEVAGFLEKMARDCFDWEVETSIKELRRKYARLGAGGCSSELKLKLIAAISSAQQQQRAAAAGKEKSEAAFSLGESVVLTGLTAERFNGRVGTVRALPSQGSSDSNGRQAAEAEEAPAAQANEKSKDTGKTKKGAGGSKAKSQQGGGGEVEGGHGGRYEIVLRRETAAAGSEETVKVREANLQRRSDEATCSICRALLATEPLLLDCGHEFCALCLHSLREKLAEGAERDAREAADDTDPVEAAAALAYASAPTCPNCRAPWSTADKATVEECARRLPEVVHKRAQSSAKSKAYADLAQRLRVKERLAAARATPNRSVGLRAEHDLQDELAAKMSEVVGPDEEAEKRLFGGLRTGEDPRAAFRSVISTVTNVAKNARDPLGDGDQCPVHAHQDPSSDGHLFRCGWSEGFDLMDMIQGLVGGGLSRVGDGYDESQTSFLQMCCMGVPAAVAKAVEAAGPKGSAGRKALLEQRFSLMRLTPLMVVVSGEKNLRVVNADSGVETQQRDRAEWVRTARVLLEGGARPGAKDVAGYSASHHASSFNATPAGLSILRLLSKHGADLNAPNRFGAVPMGESIRSHKPGTLRVLLELGADPTVPDDNDADSRKFTPLFQARMVPSILRLMKEFGWGGGGAGGSSSSGGGGGKKRTKGVGEKAAASSPLKPAGVEVPECANCLSIEGTLMRCGACKGPYYCGRNCQSQHWKDRHKHNCLKP